MRFVTMHTSSYSTSMKKPFSTPAGFWKASAFNMVYCAGIFDYLSDRICKQLMNIFYELLEPGGLLVATNVDSANPSRNGMEYLLEWHLIHRTRSQLRGLV